MQWRSFVALCGDCRIRRTIKVRSYPVIKVSTLKGTSIIAAIISETLQIMPYMYEKVLFVALLCRNNECSPCDPL